MIQPEAGKLVGHFTMRKEQGMMSVPIPIDGFLIQENQTIMNAKLPKMKPVGALIGSGSLVALGLGLLVTFADTPPKVADEPWSAPARAARKQNPVPADDKSAAPSPLPALP